MSYHLVVCKLGERDVLQNELFENKTDICGLMRTLLCKLSRSASNLDMSFRTTDSIVRGL